MNLVDHRIARNDQLLPGGRPQHRRIVADADRNAGRRPAIRRALRMQPVEHANQSKLVHA